MSVHVNPAPMTLCIVLGILLDKHLDICCEFFSSKSCVKKFPANSSPVANKKCSHMPSCTCTFHHEFPNCCLLFEISFLVLWRGWLSFQVLDEFLEGLQQRLEDSDRY